MSMRVVLDGATWIDALTDDAQGVLSTLIEVCDQIVLNKLIKREYLNTSAILPRLEQLHEMRPRPKVIEPQMGPAAQNPMPAHHQNLFQGAMRAQANIVIFSAQSRGKWDELFQRLQLECQLTVQTPEEYVAGHNRL